MNQHPCSGLHLGSVSPEKFGAVLVRPVVEDLADVVNIGTDRLRREDVVRHEMNAFFERVWHGGVGVGFIHLHVLHQEVKVGETLGQRDGNATSETPHVDHFSHAKPLPVVAVEEVVQLITGKLPLRSHAASEQFSILSIFGNVFKVGAFHVVRKVESLDSGQDLY